MSGPYTSRAETAVYEPTRTRRRKDDQRRSRDLTPRLRQWGQVAFLALNLWIGAEFYTWVRYWERGGQGLYVSRPPGVEGWLPIASLMNLKYWLVTGDVPDHHAAGMFLLVAFLLVAWLARKAFCSWLCPIGTISEWLWKLGRHLFGRTTRLPRWVDLALRPAKYLLLGFFLWVILPMPTAAIRAFLDSPYGWIADVKMLNFFRFLSPTAAIVLTILIVLSLLVQNFWCRYLCPYGALLGLLAAISPMRIRRNPVSCIDCGKCSRACPSWIPVDRLLTVRTPECTGCYECVAGCPVRDALGMEVRRRVVPGWVVGALAWGIFLVLVVVARAGGYWYTELPPEVYRELIPRAHLFRHP